MRFLLDAHLPPVLKRIMTREGYEAVHVYELGLGAAEDSEIWEYARENAYVVISKDDDFARQVGAFGTAPQLLWIRTGNCSDRELIAAVLSHIPDSRSLFLAGHSLVEIRRR